MSKDDFLYVLLSSTDEHKREHQGVNLEKEKDKIWVSKDYEMDRTHHVIDVALRCGNIVNVVHQKALRDVRYKEYLIPHDWKALHVITLDRLNCLLHGNEKQSHPWEVCHNL
ncbi:hypothetical protein ABZP36_021182 [Zizania latifolia]